MLAEGWGEAAASHLKAEDKLDGGATGQDAVVGVADEKEVQQAQQEHQGCEGLTRKGANEPGHPPPQTLGRLPPEEHGGRAGASAPGKLRANKGLN